MAGRLAALLLTACRGEPDALRYREALAGAATWAEAREACAGMRDEGGRSDCLLAAMDRFDRLDAAGCATLGDPVWADECRFRLAERLGERGELARGLALCARTRFRRDCQWHLLQDEAERGLGEPPAVAEARLDAFSGAVALPDAGGQFWLIRFREAAAAGEPADEASCEGLRRPEDCRAGLRRFLRESLDRAARGGGLDCVAGLAPRVTRRGRPVWSEGPFTRSVVAAWLAERCAAGAGDPPPVSSAAGGPRAGPEAGR